MIEEEISKLGLANVVELWQSHVTSPITELLHTINCLLRQIKLLHMSHYAAIQRLQTVEDLEQ